MIRLGVDLGGRRVGLAVSDPDGRLAVPAGHAVVASADEALDAVDAAARRHGAAEIVLGLPRRLDGRDGPAARAVRLFADRCRGRGWTVLLWDERLTTGEAERALKDAKLSRRARGGVVDSVAAQRILASYLERVARR